MSLSAKSGESLEEKVKRLGKLGREVDKAFAKARSQAEAAIAAKGRAENLQRQFRELARELMGDEA